MDFGSTAWYSERVQCSISAAAKYDIPANVLLAIAEQEGGAPGLRVPAANGTVDIGPLQFNSSYVAELAPFGIRASHVVAGGCFSYELAAWRLREHLLHDRGDVWMRAANYHSRTPSYNMTYREQLVVRASKWTPWLQAQYPNASIVIYAPATSTDSAVLPQNGAIASWQTPRRIGSSHSRFVSRSITASP